MGQGGIVWISSSHLGTRHARSSSSIIRRLLVASQLFHEGFPVASLRFAVELFTANSEGLTSLEAFEPAPCWQKH
jgi:hypothetical protein